MSKLTDHVNTMVHKELEHMQAQSAPAKKQVRHDIWLRSEKACKQWLQDKGLTGKNGRIFKAGKVLDNSYYGAYSASQWIIVLIEEQ